MQQVIMRLPQVAALVGLSRSTIYKLMSRNAFPRPVRLSTRAIGWRASDIQAWLESRPQAAARSGGDEQ